MNIRRKADIETLLGKFDQSMPFDDRGKKHYFVFPDGKRGGDWTLMRYADGLFTVHGRGENYCDQGECIMSRTDLHSFLWNNRKAINESLKRQVMSSQV